MSRLIIVLGMHRSGSSLVTKGLECLGVSLGDRADWSAPDNPTGFHEDLDILAIDEAVLKRCGSAWDQPLDLGRAVFLSDLEVVAKRTLGDKLERFPLFGSRKIRDFAGGCRSGCRLSIASDAMLGLFRCSAHRSRLPTLWSSAMAATGLTG